MYHRQAVHAGVVALVLAAAALAVGCSISKSEIVPTAPNESTSGVTPTAAAEVHVAGNPRPTVAEAEAAVLTLAKSAYPDLPITEASIRSMGQDSQGRWWVRGLTPVPEYETEQWFITFDGSDWVVQDSGTGMEESDFPSDIAWEDVQ